MNFEPEIKSGIPIPAGNDGKTFYRLWRVA